MSWTIRTAEVDDCGRNAAVHADSAPSRNPELHASLLEASRVARELHDGVAQSLFAIASTAKELRDRHPLEPSTRRDLEAILALAQAGSRQLREAFGGLGGAGSVARDGLAAAVSELRDGARGIAVEVAVDDELADARGFVAELLYRACREGLANAVRHAGARRCRIRCTAGGAVASAVVEDDGTGAGTDAAAAGFGLRFLAELLESAGGALELEGSRRGTLLRARVPLAP
jgi:two-component system sensor histidine kinase DesK